MASQQILQHLLQLKVMRLSRPTFPVRTLSEPERLALPLEPGLSLDSTSALPDPTELLSLPSAFGNIYLGETFSSYIALSNEFPHAVDNVVLRVELQTNSQKLLLADSAAPGEAVGETPTLRRSAVASIIGNGQELGTPGQINAPEVPLNLQQGESAEWPLSHEIKELGTHILVCAVQYSISQERRLFRKFYKFQVLNPLSVRTKVNTFGNGTVSLEAQVQNANVSDMNVDSLFLETGGTFSHRYVAFSGSDADAKKVDSVWTNSRQVLRPQEACQFLYLLEPSETDPTARSSQQLGKVDISWKTSSGGKGRLQTSQLSRRLAPPEPFEGTITALEPAGVITVENFVTCHLQIRNNQATEVSQFAVSLVNVKSPGLVLVTPSSVQTGPVAPGSVALVKATFRAIQPGLHRIGGILVTDLGTGIAKAVESSVQVLVQG